MSQVTSVSSVKPTVDSIAISWEEDDAPDVSYLEEPGEEPCEGDKERLRRYHAGEWIMQGVTAYATVSYPLDSQGNRRLQEFTSGGLWGIESDSGSDYKRDEEIVQLRELKAHLETFGVDTSRFWELAGVDDREKAWYQERVNACVKPSPVLEW